MPMATRKSNAVAHPGFPDRPQIRRTSKQVEDDKAVALAASAAAREKEQANRRAVLISIAQIEDRAEKEEQLRLQSKRPDLWHASEQNEPMESNDEDRSPIPYPDPEWDEEDEGGEEGEEGEDEEGDEEEGDEEDEAAFSPPASTVQNSSFSLGADHGHSDPDVERNQSSDEETSEQVSMQVPQQRLGVTKAAKKAEKPPRGSLRAEISAFRSVPDTSLKRKAISQPSTAPSGQKTYKRLKRSHAMIGGLTDNWQKRISSIPVRVTSVVGARGSTEECEENIFTADGPQSVLERARESRSLSGSTSRSSSSGPIRLFPNLGTIGPSTVPRRTAQAGLSLMRITPSPSGTGSDPSTYRDEDDASPESVQSRAGPKPKKSNLRDLVTVFPICPERDEYVRMWHKYYVPHLLSWAGAQEDPFGTNCKTDTLSDIWQKVFPGVLLEGDAVIVLRDICDGMLTSWRSEIGKAGRAAVTEGFNSDADSFQTPESRRDYVSQISDGAGFIYKDPDTNCGAFCSDLVAIVYATHLRKIAVLENDHMYQIGALALATVAVERGLSLFETGEDAIEVWRMSNDGQTPNGRNRIPRHLQFMDRPWGGKARRLISKMKDIEERGWTAIIACASKFLSPSSGFPGPEVDEGVLAKESTDLYSNINLKY